MAEARAPATAHSLASLLALVKNATRLGRIVTTSAIGVLDHQIPAIIATRATIRHHVAHLPTFLRSMAEQMRILPTIHTGNFFRKVHLSSAIAAGLALGRSLPESVEGAVEYVQGCLRDSLAPIAGHIGLLGHKLRD